MPPKMGPQTEPKTDENTMNATAYCCSSAVHISATGEKSEGSVVYQHAKSERRTHPKRH